MLGERGPWGGVGTWCSVAFVSLELLVLFSVSDQPLFRWTRCVDGGSLTEGFWSGRHSVSLKWLLISATGPSRPMSCLWKIPVSLFPRTSLPCHHAVTWCDDRVSDVLTIKAVPNPGEGAGGGGCELLNGVKMLCSGLLCWEEFA